MITIRDAIVCRTVNPTHQPETRGRKKLPDAKKRKRTNFTLSPKRVEEVFKAAERCKVSASRFVEFATGVAILSINDPAYRAAVRGER